MVLQHNIRIDQEALAAFCRRNHIRKLSLFGSVLTDRFRPDSDVDVLVEFEPGTRTGFLFFELQEQLSELLDRRVDLNTKGFLGPRIYPQVERESEVLYTAD
jgi:predicted nucleotidyltransferase